MLCGLANRKHVALIENSPAVRFAGPTAFGLRVAPVARPCGGPVLTDTVRDVDDVVAREQMRRAHATRIVAVVQDVNPARQDPTTLEHLEIVEAMQGGAFDFLTKPIQAERMMRALSRASEAVAVRRELAHLRQTRRAEYDWVVGETAAMKRIAELIDRAAPTQASVLICGESGTGKEMVANAIHQVSPRREAAFVAINCAALPDQLLESELFGHEPQAFTGATKRKPGLMEIADGGTLFLDEIGEAPLGIQVKLLRVLQKPEFRRIGGTRDIKVDVRIIAATNKDLTKAVAQGAFREDLYYRLNVIPITTPPLRAHPEDIPLLVRHFLAVFGRKANKPALTVAPAAMQALQRNEWRGNVRELENVLERVVAFAPGTEITLDDVAQWMGAPSRGNEQKVPADIPSEGLDLESLINGIERELLVKALERSGGVKKDAARLLKLDARSLRYRLDKYEIKAGDGASAGSEDDEGGEGD